MDTNGTNAPAIVHQMGINSLEAYARGLDTKLRIASVLLKSGMLPSHLKTPEAVLGTILKGQEMGFSPIASCSLINFIQGQATLNAQGMQAKALQHGGIFEEVDWTDKVCTLKVSRLMPGQPKAWTRIFSYSLADAALAGLAHKDNWKKQPKAMLYARCVSAACRAMWADVLAGVYSTEEMVDSTSGGTFEYTEQGDIANVRTGEVIQEAPVNQIIPQNPIKRAEALASAPVREDYYYGWEISDPEHPKLLKIAQDYRRKGAGPGWDKVKKMWLFHEEIPELRAFLISGPVDIVEPPLQTQMDEVFSGDDIPFGDQNI